MVAKIIAYRTCPASIRPVIAAAAALILILSCGHHRQGGEPGWHDVNRAAGPKHGLPPWHIRKQLEAEYRRWQGTPHRLGGNGPNGVDCSGFVKAVCKNVFKTVLSSTLSRLDIQQSSADKRSKLHKCSKV